MCLSLGHACSIVSGTAIPHFTPQNCCYHWADDYIWSGVAMDSDSQNDGHSDGHNDGHKKSQSYRRIELITGTPAVQRRSAKERAADRCGEL
jgi:hypothetical protein